MGYPKLISACSQELCHAVKQGLSLGEELDKHICYMKKMFEK